MTTPAGFRPRDLAPSSARDRMRVRRVLLGEVRARLIASKLAIPYENTPTPGLPYGSTMTLWLEGEWGTDGVGRLPDDAPVWIAEFPRLMGASIIGWFARVDQKTSIYVAPAWRQIGIATLLLRWSGETEL